MIEGRVTNISENRVHSELDGDQTTGAATILVIDIDAFDADGGTIQIGVDGGTNMEQFAYTIPEDSEGTIDLVGTLAHDHPDETPVYVDPPNYERTAYILAPRQEEELEARVPFPLYDRLPLGSRDPDDGSAEIVQAELVAGELVVKDVLGQDRKRMEWGNGAVTIGGGGNNGTTTVNHHLEVTPVAVLATINDPDTNGIIRTSARDFDSFDVTISHRDPGSNYTPGTILAFSWLAIG